ncbi:MAG: SDR family oxidoreductase [Anaerolineales bacterium]
MSSMVGKQVVITGGTSGIGRATAIALARLGASVAISGRDTKAAANTMAQLRDDNGRDDFAFHPADLAVMADVRRLAAELESSYPAIDVLMNNAGGFFLRRSETADGLERTFAVNHLSVFLLTNLLRDHLLAADHARIITTSSASHRSGSMHFDDLGLKENYSGWAAYGQSKLANVLFTHELARRIPVATATANAFHPGFVRTNLARRHPLLRPIVGLVYMLMAKSPEEGARTAVYLASSPSVAETSGEYFVDERQVRSAPQSYDPAAAGRLWQASASMVGLKQEQGFLPKASR